MGTAINRWLLITVILFATLDGLRDTFIPGNPISYIKEIAVFLLFINLLCARIKKSENIIRPGIIWHAGWMFFLIITLSTTIYFHGEKIGRADELSFGGASVWLKLLIQYLLIQALIWLREDSPSVYKSIPTTYITGALIYCALSIIALTTGLSERLTPRDWGGRYSIGYPTMDSYMLATAGLFVAYYMNARTAQKTLGIIIFAFLLMQNTITGYLLIFIGLAFLVIYLPGKKKITPVALIAALLIIGAYLYLYVLDSMGVFGALLIDKINGIFLGSQTASSTVRQDQIARLVALAASDPIQTLFGMGGEAAFIVENNYIALYGLGGVFAVILFFLALIKLTAAAIISENKKMLIPAIAMYLAGGLSLISFYLFPFIFAFAYIASESLTPKKSKRNEMHI